LKQTSNEIIIDPHEPSRANNSARSKEYPKDQSLQAARLANFCLTSKKKAMCQRTPAAMQNSTNFPHILLLVPVIS
jgi:hypothetical protein